MGKLQITFKCKKTQKSVMKKKDRTGKNVEKWERLGSVEKKEKKSFRHNFRTYFKIPFAF